MSDLGTNLGELIGSLMSGMLRARCIADEQTAALAEYYKDNPLLESLSVPRIRIPELTIDVPMLIEGDVKGEKGVMAEPASIASAAETQLKSTSTKNNIKINAAFRGAFSNQVKTQLTSLKKSGTPIMKETVARTVHDAFTATLIKTKTPLTASEKEKIAKDIRTKVSNVSHAKEPVIPGIMANIKTADVKERASDKNVVRLKITMREEGLEWATHAGESGGIVRTLEPE